VYADELLQLLGADRSARTSGQPDARLATWTLPAHIDDDPGSWASSGAMSLTGHADRPPLDPGGPAIRRMIGAGAAAQLIASTMGVTLEIDAPALLGERAALAGLSRRGRRSVGGSCEILPCDEGWIALNLPREDDIELVPAWLRDGELVDASPATLSQALLRHTRSSLIPSAQTLGIAVSAVGESCCSETAPENQGVQTPFRLSAKGSDEHPFAPRRWRAGHTPLVIDLTGLWAGPLCASLLVDCGARVIKVESRARPDGARSGSGEFFDLLNGGKLSVDLDPRGPVDRERLRRLILQADLVIESFRPHAMPRLGLGREEMMNLNPDLSWLSLNAYDRQSPMAERVGYGDDVAVSAGLVAIDHCGLPVFCADAVADPMTGLLAFVVALSCLAGAGGHQADICMQDVVASLTRTREGSVPPATPHDEPSPPAPPRARPLRRAARPLGADTADVLQHLGIV